MTKSVIITGVNGGIGKALSKAFNSSGYTTIGMDIIADNSNCDQFIKIDLDQFASDNKYRNIFEEIILAKTENLEVLINNAAVQILEHFTQLTHNDWHKTLNVNVSAAFFLSQMCYAQLRKNKGSIINIASIHSNQTKRNFVAYATSKAAIEGMTKAMAVDAQGEVRVNGISPAAIETEMLKDGFSGKEKMLDNLKNFHPSKVIGTVEEVARLALFIADKKNAFFNGSVVKLDGAISSVLHDPDQNQ
jgi:NAD(P)-dependent dehydrogenase (short-subunit alcohol dehydrogenase family)